MTTCCDPTDPMDCAERAACEEVGTSGHNFCGTCETHQQARHRCGGACAIGLETESPEAWLDEIMAEFEAMSPEEQERHLAAQWAELEASLGL